MIKRLLPLLILLTLLTGCKRNEFRIQFHLPGTINDSFTMLYYASDSEKGRLTDRVAVITGGSGEVKCATVYPTLVYVFKGSNEPSLVIYAERGDQITVTGDNDSPNTWQVEGNEINKNLTAWRLKNREVLSSRNPQKVNDAVAGYVKANPDNPVATLLLQVYYDRGSDPKGFDRLFKLLKGHAVDPQWTDLISRNDMLGGYAPASFKTGPIILRTAGNGCDTIRFDSIPALLYFNNNYTDRMADIVRLKELLKERPDSGNPQIIDVNMEPDSSSWRYQTRRDTLKGAIRAWIPLGLSDTVTRSLGVRSVPTFLIIGNGGTILYRGASIDTAQVRFRKFIKRK